MFGKKNMVLTSELMF